MSEHLDDEPSHDENWQSKSQLKREMQQLKALGERLLSLNESQLAQVPQTEDLAAALAEAKRLKSREGLRRQKQYIAKVMRHADVEGIKIVLERFDTAHQLNTRAFHDLETLREELISGDKQALGTAIARFPDVDRQKLRQLVKNAKKEREQNLKSGSRETRQSRLLFRFLREQSQEAPGSSDI